MLSGLCYGDGLKEDILTNPRDGLPINIGTKLETSDGFSALNKIN
jgi:hypothetical protein